MSENSHLILASASKSRQQLLKNAGLKFQVKVSNVDEDAIKTAFNKDGELTDLPNLLAQAKALVVSQSEPSAFVIGADQVLLFGKQVFDKPTSRDNARDQLLQLRGKTHRLESAVCVAKDNEVIWSYSEAAYLSMRDFSPQFLGHYLAFEGDGIMTTVGGYKLEGMGLQLFDKIEGDFFAILGLPMLKLLEFLRSQQLIET